MTIVASPSLVLCDLSDPGLENVESLDIGLVAPDAEWTIDVPGTPRGMLQYDTATVMRTRSGKVVSVWERLNHPGEGIGIWKLPTGKRYTYTYELTHWTFDCAARTKSRGAVGFFDAAGHLVEAQPDISLDGLDPVFSPVEAGSWTAAAPWPGPSG